MMLSIIFGVYPSAKRFSEADFMQTDKQKLHIQFLVDHTGRNRCTFMDVNLETLPFLLQAHFLASEIMASIKKAANQTVAFYIVIGTKIRWVGRCFLPCKSPRRD